MLIMVHDTDRGVIWLNPSHVVSVVPSGDGALVETSDTSSWRVNESADEVARLCKEAK